MKKEVRCKKCKKLLGRFDIVGYIELKCSRCGFLNILRFVEAKFEKHGLIVTKA